MPSFKQWQADLASIPKEEQRQFVFDTLRHKKNLHIFGKFFFPHIIKGENEVPDSHKDLISEITKQKDSGIIFPRGFSKSTWIKIDLLHDIVYGLEPVILYVANNLTDAGFHFESMKAELENNDRLRYVYGNLVPLDSKDSKKWTNRHFETTNGVNVVARGANKGRGVNIKNQRPTKIVIDDVEDDEMVRSAERRQKLHSWLTQVIFPSVDKMRGKIKMVGTVLHEKCEVLAFYTQHGGIYRQATEDGTLNPDSISIWPEMWSIPDLIAQKAKIGTRAFMQEYMNTPTNEELANFNAKFIDENTYTLLPKFTHVRKVIHLDPQAGESALADEYGLTLLMWEWKDIHRYVVEQQSGRVSQWEQAKLVVRMWRNHPDALVAGVEKVMNQTAVWQHIRDWKAGKLDFGDKFLDDGNRDIPLVAHAPNKSGSTKGIDKLGRLQMQEPSFERGEIHLHHSMRKLRDQILFLGTKLIDHDDCADSLLGAIELSNRGSWYKSFAEEEEKVYTVGNKYRTNEERTAEQTIMGNLMEEEHF
jgi:hypothetical protein